MSTFWAKVRESPGLYLFLACFLLAVIVVTTYLLLHPEVIGASPPALDVCQRRGCF